MMWGKYWRFSYLFLSKLAIKQTTCAVKCMNRNTVDSNTMSHFLSLKLKSKTLVKEPKLDLNGENLVLDGVQIKLLF